MSLDLWVAGGVDRVQLRRSLKTLVVVHPLEVLAQGLQGSTTGQLSVECCRSLPSNTPPALLRFWPLLSAESG